MGTGWDGTGRDETRQKDKIGEHTPRLLLAHWPHTGLFLVSWQRMLLLAAATADAACRCSCSCSLTLFLLGISLFRSLTLISFLSCIRYGMRTTSPSEKHAGLPTEGERKRRTEPRRETERARADRISRRLSASKQAPSFTAYFIRAAPYMLHRNSHFSVCPCRAHMPRPDICSRWCRRRRCRCRRRRRRRRRLCRCCRCSPPAHGSPSSSSSSSSLLDHLSLALSHSCHAARTSDNSTALRGKAKSRRPTAPAFSFWRILLFFSLGLCLARALFLSPSRPGPSASGARTRSSCSLFLFLFLFPFLGRTVRRTGYARLLLFRSPLFFGARHLGFPESRVTGCAARTRTEHPAETTGARYR